MGLLDLLNHLLNFLAPAAVVGLLLALMDRFLVARKPFALAWYGVLAINFIAGAVALALGLWFFGNDGKMASYGAMLAACAFSQWYLGR